MQEKLLGEGMVLMEHGERLLWARWSRREGPGPSLGAERAALGTLSGTSGAGQGSGPAVLAEVLSSPLGREPGLLGYPKVHSDTPAFYG